MTGVTPGSDQLALDRFGSTFHSPWSITGEGCRYTCRTWIYQAKESRDHRRRTFKGPRCANLGREHYREGVERMMKEMYLSGRG